MQLTRVEIEGFRSVRRKLDLYVEPNVSVILGPNDHGKTNLLTAIRFLNEDSKFDAENDINWDVQSDSENFPLLRFHFTLTSQDREQLTAIENDAREALEGAATGPAVVPPAAADVDKAALSVELVQATPILVKVKDVPETVQFYRQGVTSALNITGWDQFSDKTIQKLRSLVPRVEIVEPYARIADTVTASELTAPDKNEFMRGIFYYAGLNPNQSESLFVQNDTTERTLQTASAKLDETLKKSWSQGEKLKFQLSHYSKTDAVQLKIDDPAVTSRRVRASQRSAGFTNYFAIKTILHARQQEHPASSYLLLFDEPGLYLHPSGQFDLLQVLETLSKTDQVIYVTHSLFMINKSYPTRHRLVLKTDEGTIIESKPFISRWGSVLTNLGLSLSGTILFANEILLTEGDSDPVLIQACFQKMIRENKLNVEINGFSALGTTNGKNADVMLRVLRESTPTPRLMMLFDGDEGGKDREAQLKQLITDWKIPTYRLESGLTIEDYLPGGDNLYAAAVAAYVSKLDSKQQNTDTRADAEESLAGWRSGKKNGSVTSWTDDFAKKHGFKSGLSRVGVAREYLGLLEDAPIQPRNSKRCLSLLNEIIRSLKIPPQAPAPPRVLRAEA